MWNSSARWRRASSSTQQWQQDERVVLFVRSSSSGLKLDEPLRRICQQIKQHCTARHVPARILQVDAIPAPSPAR